MPNPWDAGSARALEQLGFEALATTSAGFAWTRGCADNQVTRDEVVAPVGVAENVRMAADTGIAGRSIEDASGEPTKPLWAFDLAVERVAAARRAIDESGTGLVLTGRSEGFVCGRPDIAETVRRLRAFAEAGAECVYAPGGSSRCSTSPQWSRRCRRHR